MLHEIVHDMEGTTEYNELRKIVLDYAKKQKNYDNARKNLEDMYSSVYDKNSNDFESLIDQEVVADILGEKLGDQEFINSLVKQNRNVAQKIYDWVIDKLNSFSQAIGFNNEYLYWKNVENKFRNAFNSEFNNIEGGTKFSIQTNTNGNKYIEIDTDILKGVPQKEWIAKIKEVFKTQFPNGIDMGFFNVGLNAKSIREFLNSKYTQEIKANKKDIYSAKLKMANNLDEIVQNASNVKNETARHKNYKSYNRGYVGVKIGDNFYNIEVLTGINSKNKEMFYDIVNIKKGLLSSSLSTENDSNPITDIISSNKNYVNNNILEKDNKGRKLSQQQQEKSKNVDNTNPTDSDDIRYSKESNGEYQKFLKDNFSNNGTKTTMSEVLLPNNENGNYNMQNNISPIIEEAQLKKDVENFSNQIDSVINGTFPKGNMITLLSNTPKLLQDIGLSNYPITMTQRHLDTIMNKAGKYKNANYHNLGEEIVKQLPQAIANPLDVVQSNTDKNSIVITTYLADKENRTVIASIKMNGRGTIDDIRIDTNVMTSAYGRNNYDKFMKDNIQKGNLLYDVDQGVIKKLTGQGYNYLDASTSINNIIPSSQNYVNNRENRNISPTAKTNKVMNPVEIANLTEKDASSTPIAPTRNYGKGNKESRFYRNVTSNSKFLNQELRQELKNEDDVRFYQGVTNEESLTNALKKLNDGGENETLSWFNKDSFDAEDVAEGWILMKRYQDAGDYRGVVEVIKKMRNQGTTAGQTIQAFNIMNRLTPEGMVNYAQGELSEAFEKMSKNKTKEWIDANREKFELTPEETAFIMNNIQEAQTLESDSRERAIKLGEIQKVMKDKLPPDKGAGIKAWMRISMLFNPKTQVRNVAGNAIIAPVNAVSDIVSAGVDKVLSKKTGVRTTGVPNLKSMIKGAGKGLYNSYDDFKRDINTRNMTGNRYEFNEGDKKSIIP